MSVSTPDRDCETPPVGRKLWPMKISARNVLNGRVTRIVDGAVNCEIALEIAPGVEIVSIITKSSVDSLGLAVGGEASAVVKASSVMIAVE